MGGGGGVVTVNVQEAARHPVLYDNFYLVQCLLDIKPKFIPPVIADQLLTKFKMAKYQQAHYSGSHNHSPHKFQQTRNFCLRTFLLDLLLFKGKRSAK